MNMKLPADRLTTIVLIASFLIVAGHLANHAVAQPDLLRLSDDEVIEQLHREAYRQEFDRRMRLYTPDKRIELAEKRAKQPRLRQFPDGYSDDELIAICDFGDMEPAQKAIAALKSRYATADQAQIAAMAARLRAAYAATPYPSMTASNFDSPAYHASDNVYQGLNAAVKACLPEEEAIRLLLNVYIEPKPFRGVTRFLEVVRGEPFKGEVTLRALLELRMQLLNEYTPEGLLEAGEDSNLLDPLESRIAFCGDSGFEAFRELDWESPIGIRTMGSIDRPEARELLLNLYVETPVEQLDRRLNILGALAIHSDPASENPVRQFLRDELSSIILGDHFARPIMLSSAVQIAADTRDPYFLTTIHTLREKLAPARVQENASASDAEAAALNYCSLIESVAEATTKLEKAAAKAGSAPRTE